jgi:hypothetical protein
MSLPVQTVQEANLRRTPLRDLHLEIAGTRLEPIIRQSEQELKQAGVQRVIRLGSAAGLRALICTP